MSIEAECNVNEEHQMYEVFSVCCTSEFAPTVVIRDERAGGLRRKTSAFGSRGAKFRTHSDLRLKLTEEDQMI